MQSLLYIQMNAFALAVILIIFLNIYHRAERFLTEQKYFMLLLGFNALILLFDTVMWGIDGREGVLAMYINQIASALYYILSPIICLIWLFYADYQVTRDMQRTRRMLVPMLIPIAINTILSIASMFTNILFYVDEHNIYHRGRLSFVMVAIGYFYLIYAMASVLRYRNRIDRNTFYSILLFVVPPAIGGILQSLCYGTSLVWTIMALSMLVIFINIQSSHLYVDYLTGLFNRRQLDYYLESQMRANRGHFAGIMIDLDSFKRINDRFGHHVGDQALEDTARILKKTFHAGDFIARYGGDEFVVIIQIDVYADLAAAVSRLRENVKLFNQQNSAPYTICLSLGYDMFLSKSQQTADEFLNHIDNLMYEEKLSKVKID